MEYSIWKTSKGRDCRRPGGAIPQEEKAATMVPASSFYRSLVFEKTYRLFFFFASFFIFFLAAFFFGLDFFLFGAAFFFAALLAGFFAPGLGAGLGAGASSSGSPTITNSSSSVSAISSVSPASSSSSSSRDSSLSSSKLSFSKSIPSSPGGILGPHSQKGSCGSLFWPESRHHSTPSVSRCYRTPRELSSILRYSRQSSAGEADSKVMTN